MKNRVITMLFVTAMSCTILVALAFAAKAKEDNYHVDVAESFESMPVGLSIARGSSKNNIGLEISKKLDRSNGKYVNLHVENQGDIYVTATINGESPKTFEPGEKDHIYVEVTQNWLGYDREYEFKAVSAGDGGIVNIYYEITQQDSLD